MSNRNRESNNSVSHSHSDDTDNEMLLITRVKQSDIQAFEQLYRLHSGRVYALCIRLSGNRALAEEFAQEAFIRAWQKIKSFRGESSFSSWLYRLTTNVVLSELRKKNIQQVNIDDVASDKDTTTNHLETGKLMDMEQAIKQLPEGARMIFVLHDIEGYQHNEIAQLTGLAIGTSKAQLHRARKLLKGWLS